MKPLESWANYKLPKNVWNTYAPEALKLNVQMLSTASLVGSFAFLVFSIFPFLISRAVTTGLFHLAMSLVCLLVFSVSSGYKSGYLAPEKTFFPVMLLFDATLMAFAMTIGVFRAQNTTAVTFCILFIGLSTIFLLQPVVSLLILLVELVVFCVCTVLVKPANIYMLDITNILLTFVVSMVVSWNMNYMRVSDIVARRQLEADQEALHVQSITDELTGLHNRRYFFRTLADLVSASSYPTDTLCVAVLDVDFFKNYNDFYGYPEGDHVLRAIGGVLPEAAKKHEVELARVGGEEFALTWVGATVEQAEQVALEICKAVAGLGIAHPQSAVADHITVSAGICVVRNPSSKAVDAIYTETDHALYEAKRRGRNCVVRYDSENKEFYDVAAR